MPTPYTIIAVLLSFFITLFSLPFWIRRARQHKLTGIDMHKVDGREVAELGGLVTVFSAVVGIMFYISLHVFIYKSFNVMTLMAASASILVALVIGLFDDILGWKVGLRQYQKPILSLLIALPIIVINAGQKVMTVPFFGSIDLGILYPLAVIPVAVIGSSNAFNMIAGFNGLEAGMGLITIGTLGIITYVSQASFAAILAFCLFASLLAFFVFNKSPAVVFPGNSLTYPIGASIAIIAILGNVEMFALMLFLLYFIEFILKARGFFQKESFAKVKQDGTLVNRYDKWYSLCHVAVSMLEKCAGRAKEQTVVASILLVQVMIAILTMIYFFS